MIITIRHLHKQRYKLPDLKKETLKSLRADTAGTTFHPYMDL